MHKRISLDVLVTGRDGKPVGGLEPFDLKLIDNNQPAKILSFQRTDGLAGNRIDPPVELIVVLDAVNLPYTAVTQQRQQLDKFLRANNGQLALPTTILLFSSKGVHVQPMPSKDGNALATMLDQSTGTVRARTLDGGVYSLQEQFQDSFKAFKAIVENEARRPGRKVMIWIGPGWPLLTERYYLLANPAREYYFRQLVAVSEDLRQGRIVLYNVAPVVGVTRELYKDFLKPVIEPHKMEIADLALEVLSVQTGGRILDPGNDLAALIQDCLADVGTYYTVTFVPPPASHADEYHNLKVEVGQPGMSARTSIGYYDEP